MSDDDRLAALRSTAHPLRLRMLSLLTGSAMSAAELARELGTSHANASYHLRILADAGEVVVDSEEKIRGGVAKRYRHPWDRERSPAEKAGLDSAGEVRAMAAELVRRFTLVDPEAPSTLADAELWLDPDDWKRAMTLVREAAELVHREARTPRTPGTRRVNLSLAAFGMDDSTTEQS